MKEFKKKVLIIAMLATLFNPCNVMASESEEIDTDEEIQNVNRRIDEIQSRQEKIISLLQDLEKSRVNSSVLVNPSDERKINYTQDGANSQENSTVVFQYAPNQLYKIYCRVGYLTDLSFKKDEKITFVGGGDTSAWAVETSTVNGVAHIYIKPTVDTNTTNMIIATDKRSYQLILTTSEWYNPMVTWTYGLEENLEINGEEEPNMLRRINGTVETLNFDYKISGDSSCKPVAVFDDGEKTIVKFGKLPKLLPSLFLKERGRKDILLANYKIFEDCYILDRIADEIELRISEKEIIKIRRNR